MALALQKGLVKANPFKAVKAPERPVSRDRHPTLTELAVIDAAAAADGSAGAQLMRFILHTGLRVTAAASLKWSEVDLESAELKLEPVAGRKFKTTLTAEHCPEINVIALDRLLGHNRRQHVGHWWSASISAHR